MAAGLKHNQMRSQSSKYQSSPFKFERILCLSVMHHYQNLTRIFLLNLFLASLALTGCTKIQAAKGTEVNLKVLKQATYQWDSVRPAVYSGYNSFDGDRWHPVTWKPKPDVANTTIHLEVVVLPTGAYDLRGWVVAEWRDELGKGHRNRSEILSGQVDDSAVPKSVTWQTSKMGDPNHVWEFYFTGADLKPGDLIIQERDQIYKYHELK